MVSYYIIKRSLTDITRHADKMVEAFVIFCAARGFHCRKRVVNLYCNKTGINHGVFGRTWVYIEAFNVKISFACVEVFVLNLAFCVAVNCVGVFCTKLFYVKMFSSHADFFIRCECYTYCSMRYIAFLQMFYHSQDFGNTCFVIGTKYSASI